MASALLPAHVAAQQCRPLLQRPDSLFGLSGQAFYIQGESATQPGQRIDLLDRFLSAYREIGATSIRIGIDWSAIQPVRPANPASPGLVFTTPAKDYDEIVASFNNIGVEVIGLFNAEPDWANTNEQHDAPPDPSPANLQAMRYAVRDAVVHMYQVGCVRRWEFWNEPSGPQLGNPDNFSLWLQASLDGVQMAEQILGVDIETAAGTPVGAFDDAVEFVRRLLDRWTPAAGSLNAFAVHPYLRAEGLAQDLSDGIGINTCLLRAVYDVAHAKIPGIRIWITEFGWTTAPGGGNTTIPEQLQADYLLRSLLWLAQPSQSFIELANTHMLHDWQNPCPVGTTPAEHQPPPSEFGYGLLRVAFCDPQVPFEDLPDDQRQKPAWSSFWTLSRNRSGLTGTPPPEPTAAQCAALLAADYPCCPCLSFDNFCNYPVGPATAGCPMLEAGGYCTDAHPGGKNFVRGSLEYGRNCPSGAGNRAPSAPSALAPDLITLSSAGLQPLSWNPSCDRDGDPVSYELSVTSPQGRVTASTSFPLYGLTTAANTAYTWQVTAVDSHQNRSPSVSATFATAGDPVCKATTCPPAGANLRPTTIHFQLADLYAGHPVPFDSGVQNTGDTGTGPFNVRWLVDGLSVGASGSRATFTVTAVARPDLTPTAIRYSAAAVVPGATVLFDSGVQNLGPGDSEDFNVRWLVDGQDVGAAGRHTGVPAGTTVLTGNSAFSWQVLPGRHTISFVVDDDNQIAETNETNNQRTVTVGTATAQPIDLAPTAITVPAGTLYAGNVVLFDSGVKNGGTQDSPPFNVRWLVDGQDVGAYGRHVGVAAGTTVLTGNSQFPWTAQAGAHAITFVVDSDNEIAETNEANNQRTVNVTVAVSPLPDLKPTAIHYPAASLLTGAAVLFDSGVTNSGAGNASGFDVRWLVDGQPVGADGFHAGVAAGATVLDGNSQFTWTAQPGTHILSFLVDYDNRVAEVNELNNAVTLVVTPVDAPRPDLRPTTIRVTPATPRSGDLVLFRSGVQNAGAGDSGPFNVRWLVDGQSVGGGAHAGVTAGAAVSDGQLSWTARPGAHTISFYVDSDNQILESNEGNNLRTVTLVVEGPRTVELYNGDMEIHSSPYYGFIDGWGPNGGWSYHADFPRPNNAGLGQSFGFYSAGTRETFGQVTSVVITPGTTYTFKSWAYPGVNTVGLLPYQLGYAAVQDSLSSFVPLATAVVSVTGNTTWVETSGVTYRTGTTGAEIGKQLIVRFGSGLDGGFDDIWFDNLTLTVQ